MGNGKMIVKKMHSVVAHWLVMAVATMFVSISHAQTTAQDPIEVGAAALARGHSATAYRAHGGSQCYFVPAHYQREQGRSKHGMP